MRKALLALLLLSAPSYAQEMKKAHFVMNYDLDATSYTYCVTTGQNGGPFDPPIPGNGQIETSGSSTTVTGVTDAANSFDPVSVGDVLLLKSAAQTLVRYVTAKASADSITVNAAVDFTVAGGFSWYKVTCGTAATSGWMDVAGYTGKKIVFEITQMVATGGVDFKFECRDNTFVTSAQQVYPAESSDCGTLATLTSGVCNAATGATGNVALVFTPEEQWDACRVGMKIGSADDGNDLTTNLEIINIWFVGYKQK